MEEKCQGDLAKLFQADKNAHTEASPKFLKIVESFPGGKKEIANFLSIPRDHVIGVDARDREACLDALYEVFARIDAANGRESKAVPQQET